ncbi:MAG: hypothetical protein WBE92_14045 [Steroidobacteraceae bacterium]
MGEPSSRDTEALRARARERLRQGRLPRIKAARTWGGLGSGSPCDLCDAAILSSEPEFELQLDLSMPSESVRFHRQCHTIWSEALENYLPAHDWRPVAEELPPFGALVEARLSLGEARSLILNVRCLEAAPPAPASWINATTGTPLPEGWRPVEWRYPPGAEAEATPQPFDSSLPRRA